MKTYGNEITIHRGESFTIDKFIVNKVFHHVRSFLLSEVQFGISKSNVGCIVFQRCAVILSSLHIISLGFSEQVSIFKKVL